MVKVRIKKVAAARSLSVAVEVSNTVRPTLKVTSDSQNGELSDSVHVYFSGRSRKKKAIIIMSETASRDPELQAVADMIIIAFFFLLFPGEYTGTKYDSSPF